MLASAIARWLVAIPVSGATFAGVFVIMTRFGQHVGTGAVARTAFEVAAATLCAAVVGLTIVPHPGGRAARRVFGGVPVALGVVSLLPGLLGRSPTPASFAGVAAMLLTGFLVLKAFRRRSVPV